MAITKPLLTITNQNRDKHDQNFSIRDASYCSDQLSIDDWKTYILVELFQLEADFVQIVLLAWLESGLTVSL